MAFKTLLEKGFTFPTERGPATEREVKLIETMINGPLPPDYRDFLLHANGGEVVVPGLPEAMSGYGALIKWPKGNGYLPDEMYSIVQYFFSVKDVDAYYNNWKESLPKDTLMIGTDPGRTFYLIGFGKHNFGKIYAWRIEAVNQLEMNGEVAAFAFEGAVAESFTDLLLSLVDLDTIQY